MQLAVGDVRFEVDSGCPLWDRIASDPGARKREVHLVPPEVLRIADNWSVHDQLTV